MAVSSTARVPVFRRDDGATLAGPWLLDLITCAAPFAPALGQPEAGDLLARRISRVLAIARAYGYTSLARGAWGGGAFGSDPTRTAQDCRAAPRATGRASRNERCPTYRYGIGSIAVDADGRPYAPRRIASKHQALATFLGVEA